MATQTFKPVPHPEKDPMLPEYRSSQKGVSGSNVPLLMDYGHSKKDNKKTAEQYGLSEQTAVLPPSKKEGCLVM